jgi:nucleoside 2-deoxyribosyltransferase
MKEISMYIAGGLFNVAERAHNAVLEKTLLEIAKVREINLKTTLPQRTAMQRYLSEEQRFDVKGIVSDCENDAASHDYILCNLDGPDADSGTAVELGIARAQGLVKQKLVEIRGLRALEIKVPRIITYRTDFRTALEREVGVNAMLSPKGSEFVYYPCFKVELSEMNEYYKGLASKIIEVIQKDLS